MEILQIFKNFADFEKKFRSENISNIFLFKKNLKYIFLKKIQSWN